MAWRQMVKEAVSPLRPGLLNRRLPPSHPPINPPPIPNPNPTTARYGLPKIWGLPVSQAHAPKFRAFFNRELLLRCFSQSPGRKLLKGCFLGSSALVGVMLYPANVAHAMDERPADIMEPSGYLKDEITTLWSLVRKFQLPAVLLIMLAFGWRHPLTLAINVLLLFYCTRPNPFSIYLFVQQMRQRDMRRNPGLWNTEFLYTKKVNAEDYKLFSLGRIELRDKTLHVIGILGGWWVFHVSRD